MGRVTISAAMHADATSLHNDMLEHVIHRGWRENDPTPLA